jgi:hypothetical protein
MARASGPPEILRVWLITQVCDRKVEDYSHLKCCRWWFMEEVRTFIMQD